MDYSDIRYEVSGHIATITLDRPDKLNAWTAQMGVEVRTAMYAAEQDEDVRVIILTGAGRGFCAGADMSLLTTVASSGISQQDESDTLGRVHAGGYFPSLRKPVIAAINGPAVGLGFIISLNCDLRFAAASARFGTAFARRGLVAEYGVSWLLPRLIGPGHALDLLLSARIIDANEALQMGLVSRVVADEELMITVRSYALELATLVSPRSVRIIKRQVYDGLTQTLDEASRTAQGEMLESLRSEDFREGVAHFLEKRAARFTGR
jgi:enoyl-CoA hydratase/carnithine racemase